MPSPRPRVRALRAVLVAALAMLCWSAPNASAALSVVASSCSTGSWSYFPNGSLSVSKPAGTASGDLMVLTVNISTGWNGAGTPSGWTALNPNGSYGAGTYYKWAGGSEPSSYTLYSSFYSAGNGGATITTFRGADATTPFSTVGNGTSGTSATVNLPNDSVNRSGSIRYSAIAIGAAKSASTPAGMTAAGGCNGNSNGAYSFTESVAPGTTASRSSTIASSSSFDALTYVIQGPVVAPTITSISPPGGSTAGGTSVVITGYDFTNVSAVKFGTTAATSYTVNSGTQITAIAPAGAGTKDISVTNSAGTSANTSADDYTYYGAPTIASLAPTFGTSAGGTSVVITGTNFAGVSAVKFGATAATSYTVDSATQITATAPAGTGTQDVSVIAYGGTTANTSTDDYTYYGAPTIASLSPTFGTSAGGTSVVITGTNFAGVTAVKFGTTNASSYTVNSATQITATAPAGTGVQDVSVTAVGGTNANTSADDYTYYGAPTITSLSPSSGPPGGGTSVVITGTNFVSVTAVKFGSTNATSYTVNGTTQITATAPAGTGTQDVSVTAVGGTNANTSADDYTYLAAPTVTSVSPSSGPAAGGTSVTITGTNLTGATSVTFGGTNATSYTVNSATQITATAPAKAASTVDVLVTTVGGTSANTAADNYTYVAAPAVTSLSPTSGPPAGGTTVIVTGANLTGATSVTFGGTNATSFTVDSSTQITATSPAHASGAVDVAVTATGGTSANTSADDYTYASPPTVTSLSPTSGTTAGGTSVTITGTNLTGATAVTFGGTNATGYTVVNATTITATSPAKTAGTYDVRVTTSAGTSANTAADDYTYVVPCSSGGLTATMNDFSFPTLALDGIDHTQSTTTTVTVSDLSGAAAGWKLAIGATRFSTAGGQQLPATAARITGSSATPQGGACVAPTPAFNAYPVTLPLSPSTAKVYSAAAGTGTGPVDVTLSTQLDIPASTLVGAYTSTWTLDLTAAP